MYLEVSALVAPDKKTQLVLHMCHNSCLDRHQEVLLFSRVLQNDGKGIIDLAFDAAVRPEEPGY